MEYLFGKPPTKVAAASFDSFDQLMCERACAKIKNPKISNQ